MRYHRLGDVPAKRHAQTRRDGKLLTEEVLGYEGFSGNESILYHLHSPCRLSDIGDFEPICAMNGLHRTGYPSEYAKASFAGLG